MQNIIDNEKLHKDPNAALPEELAEDLKRLLEQGKLLREYLTNDIGTRRGPFV
jgi:hypothetical protein